MEALPETSHHRMAAEQAGDTVPCPQGRFGLWMRERRKSVDVYGLVFSLAFHGATLLQHRRNMPLGHRLFFCAYTAAVLAMLVWRRSAPRSYTAWREFTQATLRLAAFLLPYHEWLWRQSVSSDLPAPPGATSSLSALLALPILLGNTMALHLLLFAFAHPLGFGANLGVQLACAARILWVVPRGLCTSRTFAHPLTQQAVRWLWEGLGLCSSLLSLQPLAQRATTLERRCLQLAMFLEVFVGVGVQLALQAAWEAHLWEEYCQQQRQRASDRQLGGSSGRQVGGTSRSAEREVRGGLGSVMAARLAAAARSRVFALVVAVGLWDVLGYLVG